MSLSLASCDYLPYLSDGRRRDDATCDYINGANASQPDFNYKSVLYIDRETNIDKPVDWLNGEYDNTLDATPCQKICSDLVGFKGVKVYVNLGIKQYKIFKHYYGSGLLSGLELPKNLSPYLPIDGPGVYEFFPVDLSDCVKKNKFDVEYLFIDNRYFPYKYCIKSKKISNPHDLDDIKNLPLVLVDENPQWLQGKPSMAPHDFYWRKLIRVYEGGDVKITGLGGSMNTGSILRNLCRDPAGVLLNTDYN